MSRWWIFVVIALAAPASARPGAAKKGGEDGQGVTTGLWGLRLGDPPSKVKVAFAPDRGDAAQGTPTWSETASGRVTRLEFSCQRQRGCRAIPARAELDFVDGALASATLFVEPGSSPRSVEPDARLDDLQIQLKMGAPMARAQAVGRLVRYYDRGDHTVVWIRDGPETQIKVALDAKAPVPRAEAVANGASAEALEGVPGALAYVEAQRAVAGGAFSAAVDALERALAHPEVSPLLVEQGRLILSMSLAARVKIARGTPPEQARADLVRARKLAPELAKHLEQMAAELKIELPPMAKPGQLQSPKRKRGKKPDKRRRRR